jgi:hypothetical protein
MRTTLRTTGTTQLKVEYFNVEDHAPTGDTVRTYEVEEEPRTGEFQFIGQYDDGGHASFAFLADSPRARGSITDDGHCVSFPDSVRSEKSYCLVRTTTLIKDLANWSLKLKGRDGVITFTRTSQG